MTAPTWKRLMALLSTTPWLDVESAANLLRVPPAEVIAACEEHPGQLCLYVRDGERRVAVMETARGWARALRRDIRAQDPAEDE